MVIETDMVTYEVTEPESGIIHPIAPAGKDCTVEEIIGYIAETREEYEAVVTKYPLPEVKKQKRCKKRLLLVMIW
jgi:pyruvate/2-oxoglutarate dehydrogenase complex dihydrolipoamide acyltransferase (E2) component